MSSKCMSAARSTTASARTRSRRSCCRPASMRAFRSRPKGSAPRSRPSRLIASSRRPERTSMSGRRALIIGGSLGGLFAAHFLRAAGWQVTVFERTPGDLAGRGAGIGTQDALLAAMRRLGLPSGELGVALDSCICLGRDGKIAEEIAYARVMSAWARFYRPLRDALPDSDYRAGAQLTGFDQDGTTVTARFADGSRASGDLLIAADGGRSTVRNLLLPEVEPEYAGYVAWRAVAEEQNLPPEMRAPLFDHYTFALPAGEMVLAYPVPARDGTVAVGRRGYNIVWYSPASPSQLTDFCTD